MSVRIIDGVPWVGDRSFPWAEGVDHADHVLGDGATWNERRFRLRFENGWLLSVVFGCGTYSDNHHSDRRGLNFRDDVETVELAAWLADGEMVEWDEGDTVRGWVKADELLRLIDDMKDWPSKAPAGFVARIPEVVR